MSSGDLSQGKNVDRGNEDDLRTDTILHLHLEVCWCWRRNREGKRHLLRQRSEWQYSGENRNDPAPSQQAASPLDVQRLGCATLQDPGCKRGSGKARGTSFELAGSLASTNFSAYWNNQDAPPTRRICAIIKVARGFCCR